MSHGPRVGILGGTFDPIHQGHVETARAAQRALQLERVLFMPSGAPPHRHDAPMASRFHRFAMTALATNEIGDFLASDLEIGASGPSYTYDTLLRAQETGLAAAQIFFIAGADAFAEIDTWSRYPQVLDLAHFVVVARPDHPAAGIPAELPALASRMKPLTRGLALDDAQDSQLSIFLVDAVTPDVSSTAIRARLANGEPVTGLVPAAVETYICQHGLYARRRDAAGRADHLHGEN